jgi:hypothetical protein
MERRMAPLVWKAELGVARNVAFSAQLGRLITYHVLSTLASNGSISDGNAPGQTWVRAVEKFRRYEADLHERVEKTKTTNPNLGATKVSDRITVPANDETPRVNKSHNAPVGERLRRRRHAGAQERAGLDYEALRRFDELWDNVAPPRNAQKPPDASVAPALLTRLPSSVNLVAIEAKGGSANNIRGKRVFKKMLEKVLQCLEGAH